MPVLQSDPTGAPPPPEKRPPPEPAGALGTSTEIDAEKAPWTRAAAERLDPRTVALDRTINTIVGTVIAFAHLGACAIVWLTGAWSRWALMLFWASWLPVTMVLAWLAVRWPAIDYEHRRYQVSDEGILIWSGVVWRTMIAVPRTRVQHIDVTQGPLERSYGLATLSIYTAGSEYSRIDLAGLDHGVAHALRDALLPRHADPAV